MAVSSVQTVMERTEMRSPGAVTFYPMDSAPRVDWPHINRITGQIVDASLCVHSELGPGLMESAYRACLAYELRKRGLTVCEEVGLPVIYDSQRIEIGYRIDILVEFLVVGEIKSVEVIAPIHKAQLLSYLKLSGRPLGLLLNFNVGLMKNGIVRMRKRVKARHTGRPIHHREHRGHRGFKGLKVLRRLV
jgi:GxxExxY protein